MKRAFAISLALLLVSLMAASVAGAGEVERRLPMSYESERQSVLNSDMGESTRLPWGIDRMDVVRQVRKNWEEATPGTDTHTLPEPIGGHSLWSPIENSWLPDGQDFYSDVAFDGENYFVVWENVGFGYGHSSDVYGARVDASGEVLDPCGIALSARKKDERRPRVTFSGTNYLVVWIDGRNGNWDVYGARVNVSGEVLDPDGIAISTATGDQVSLDVASGGGNYLVVWHDWRNISTPDIYGARVNAAGTVRDPDGIPIATGALNQGNPVVSFGGTDYLVAWTEDRGAPPSGADICGARVDTSGLVLDPGSIVISGSNGSQYAPAIAFNGTVYLVVWTDLRNFMASSSDLYGARVSTSGIVLDPGGIPISTRSSMQMEPAVASDGTNFLATWTDTDGGSGSDIYGARVSSSGTVLVPYDIGISQAYSNQTYSAVVFGAANYLCTWTDLRSGSWSDIYGTRIDALGSVLDAGAIEIPGPRPLVQATVDLVPEILNLKGQGRWVTCYIELLDSRAYTVADIDIASVRLNGKAKPEESNWEIGDYDADGHPDLMVKFDRAKVSLALPFGHDVAATITGYVACLPFSGTDYVDVFDPREFPKPSTEGVWFAVQPTISHSCTNISFSMLNPGRVVLRVYNIAGQHIRTLVDSYYQPGRYCEVWDGRSVDGNELPAGVYVCRLEAGHFVATRKMVLLK